MVWYSHLFKFVVIHTVKGFDIVNKTEVDVFLELSCFFHDPADVGNIVSDSSAFSKTNLSTYLRINSLRVMTKRSPQEKGKANHFSTLAW